MIYIVAVPILAFNIAKAKQASPTIDKATAILIQFAKRPAGLSGDGCDATKQFSGLAVGGTFERPLVRIPAQHSCTGISVELDADDSYVIAPD